MCFCSQSSGVNLSKAAVSFLLTSVHAFRRTFTTLLKANGEDVKVVQELLRHATVKMTLEVYAQAVTPAKREAQSKVAGLLKAGSK